MPEPAELARQLAAANRTARPRAARALDLAERRLADARADARALAQTNEKLNATLARRRASRWWRCGTQLDALATPAERPSALVVAVGDGTRRRRRRRTPPARRGQPGSRAARSWLVGARVLLNEAMLVVGAAGDTPSGETGAAAWRCCPTDACW